MTCVAIDETCEQCMRRQRWHGEEAHECDDLCAVLANLLESPQGHEALHAGEYCPECNHPRWTDDGKPTHLVRPCRYGNCREWFCAGCGRPDGSDGPVMCRCSTSWPTRLMLRFFDAFYGFLGLFRRRAA